MFRTATVVLALCLCASSLRASLVPDFSSRVIISVRDQKLMLVRNGVELATYPVSTSKYGLGDRWGSLATPLGFLQVAEFGFDFNRSPLAVDLGFSIRAGHEIGAREVYLGRPAAMFIVDRWGGATGYDHVEGGRLRHGFESGCVLSQRAQGQCESCD